MNRSLRSRRVRPHPPPSRQIRLPERPTRLTDLTMLIARIGDLLDRAERLRNHRHTPLAPEAFAGKVERELASAAGGGPGGALALVRLQCLAQIGSSRDGPTREDARERITAAIALGAGRFDVFGTTEQGELAVLLPDSKIREAADRLRRMSARAASVKTDAGSRKIRATPTIGFVEFRTGTTDSYSSLLEMASQAAAEASLTRDLQPRRWVAPDQRNEGTDHHPAREALQVASTFTLGMVLPFFLYRLLDSVGFDISWPMYITVVMALVTTALLIWVEGWFALRHPGAPPEPGETEPPASAIICAYLPNEAGTIIETIEHFLSLSYPAGLQIILAYNTPHALPVEDELVSLAASDPSFVLLKVEGSNSKAQNLNAALGEVTGEFVGVFDADHQPDPGSFHRAWRWLSNGYDVVQGHCLVRNPEEAFLARMVAVEFETIYALSHPGRWLRDGFGIFGGSNGYWKTDVLHLTRMRGSMLTEDIDSSMRVLEAGGRIASDPGLISRELATSTAKQIWYQRLRWAQGWTQVSLRHLWTMLRLPHFTGRQRFGVFTLLFQREIYPWISLQIFPLLVFWWARGDLLDWLVPVFVAATVFTTSVGPGTTWLTRRVAHPSIRQRGWFGQYGLFSVLFYTEAKNVVARVAHLKELMGESSWRITPRSADPAHETPPLVLNGDRRDESSPGRSEWLRLPGFLTRGRHELRT